MSGDPSRRHFLAVVGPGAVACALAGCSSTAAPPAGDLAQSRDLAARDLGGDIAAPRDMATPDLTTPPDLSSPPDLACGGVPVPAAQMPGMDQPKIGRGNDTNLHELFEKYGLKLRDDLVLEIP